jgi:nucleoside-diphosphate-sugar epimerase
VAGEMKAIAGPDDLLLVTGANGYVGSRVVRALLAAGFRRVRCLTRPTSRSQNLEELEREYGANLEIVKGNLLSRETCGAAAAGAAVIYHLAAGVEKSYAGCFLNSVVTTRNLLDAALDGPSLRRFVNVSSIAVYSNAKIRRRRPLDESCPVESKRGLAERAEPYVFGKLKQDELVLRYARERGLRYVIVRPSVVFGPGKVKITDRVGTSTFGVFLTLGRRNKIPLTYIDNCADAVVLAGLRPGVDGQVFNVVDDDLPTGRRFLRLYKRRVSRFASVPVPYWAWFFFCMLWEKFSVRRQGQLPLAFNRRMCAVYWKGNTYPNAKAKDLLGWEPAVPMRRALETFFDYMRMMRAGRR